MKMLINAADEWPAGLVLQAWACGLRQSWELWLQPAPKSKRDRCGSVPWRPVWMNFTGWPWVFSKPFWDDGPMEMSLIEEFTTAHWDDACPVLAWYFHSFQSFCCIVKAFHLKTVFFFIAHVKVAPNNSTIKLEPIRPSKLLTTLWFCHLIVGYCWYMLEWLTSGSWFFRVCHLGRWFHFTDIFRERLGWVAVPKFHKPWIYRRIHTQHMLYVYVYIYIWVNYNELTTSSLEIIVSKGNHPQMALFQVSELL